MSRSIARRILRQSPPAVIPLGRPAPSRLQLLCIRTLSSTSRRLAEDEEPPRAASPTAEANSTPTKPASTSLLDGNIPNSKTTFTPPPNPKPQLESLFSVFSVPGESRYKPSNGASSTSLNSIGGLGRIMSDVGSTRAQTPMRSAPGNVEIQRSGLLHSLKDSHKEESWQLHIYAHRHNVHITLVRPPDWKHPITGKRYGGGNMPHRTPALSMTAGNIGFRKSAKKHYDSAFQLAVFVMSKLNDSGLSADIQALEVYLRGFGTGREAVTRVLLGPEGMSLRNKITKVTDATRLKFGGTRSPKPRRLG